MENFEEDGGCVVGDGEGVGDGGLRVVEMAEEGSPPLWRRSSVLGAWVEKIEGEKVNW